MERNIKTYKQYSESEINENLSIEVNFFEVILIGLIVKRYLVDIPRENWAQHIGEVVRNIFIDFLKLLDNYGYNVDIDVFKYKFNSLLKKAIESLKIGNWKEDGVLSGDELFDAISDVTSKDIR